MANTKQAHIINMMNALQDYVDERIFHHIARYEHGHDPDCDRLLKTASDLETTIEKLMES
jgi:flagellar biosynthesis/type III secretory pathway ATPase